MKPPTTTPRAGLKTIEVPVHGMDCADCTRHVRSAIEGLPGVNQVEVFLGAEKAVIQLDPAQVDLASIRKAVAGAGYLVPEPDEADAPSRLADFTRSVLVFFGLVFGAVLFIVVVGEWLGLFEAVTRRVPWPLGLLVVFLSGFPVFLNVLRAALKGQIISHTLMSLGVIAALAVGEWATAAVVVFFMRVGDYAERFTTERARSAIKDLASLAPQTARVERAGEEVEVPVSEVHPGEVVIVRPGEKIPVDGEVTAGQAAVDQSAITGEGLPLEAGPGAHVYAASLVSLGSLRVRAAQVGGDTTFGRVVRLVEEAEAHRAVVQRVADRFSAWYLPLVAGLAALTFLIRRDPLATAAVLVVACSCSFALATPIAMLASIGAGAGRGLMIKGGKYLELLERADVLLIDKTGTLTLGRLEITEVISFDDEITDSETLLRLAAAAERFSEHPLAEAVRARARSAGLVLEESGEFEALPGWGVRARVSGRQVMVGSRRMLMEGAAAPMSQSPSAQAASSEVAGLDTGLPEGWAAQLSALEAQGKSLLFVVVDGRPAGVLAAADTLRPEVPAALAALRELGLQQIELLTGDNGRAAASLAAALGMGDMLRWRANLLPEDKIRLVREYQAQGHVVLMVGDGVNDAPALAQADVGIAMGATGTDIAIEAAHVALMRDDWRLVPELLRIARRTMRVVKLNIAFTAVYNLVGLSLAALGYLPPIFAAAAQSLPDLGILANSMRLMKPER